MGEVGCLSTLVGMYSIKYFVKTCPGGLLIAKLVCSPFDPLLGKGYPCSIAHSSLWAELSKGKNAEAEGNNKLEPNDNQ